MWTVYWYKERNCFFIIIIIIIIIIIFIFGVKES